MDKFGLQNYILSLSEEQKEILYSWGFYDEVLTDNGLQFAVQGFLFNGTVVIFPDNDKDTFSLELKNTDGSVYAERSDVCRDDLLPTIDGLVEKNCSLEDYRKLVIAKYEMHP